MIQDTSYSKKKLYGLAVLVLGPLLLLLLILGTDAGQSLKGTDIDTLAETYRGLGIWAVLISLLLNILQTFVVFMPSVLLSGANAVVFGLYWGIVISWAGEVIGAVLAFIAYRYLGSDAVQSIAKDNKYLARIEEISSKRGFIVVLGLRVLPAFPSGLVNLLAALSQIRLSSFLLATALGKLPSLILETTIGHDLFTWRENLDRLLVLLFVAIIVYIVIKNLKRRNN